MRGSVKMGNPRSGFQADWQSNRRNRTLDTTGRVPKFGYLAGTFIHGDLILTLKTIA